MELTIRLEQDMCGCPNFIVDPAARRILRYGKDEWVCNQLWHVLVEQVLRLLDEPSVVSDDKDIPRQLYIFLNINEAAQVLLHDLA